MEKLLKTSRGRKKFRDLSQRQRQRILKEIRGNLQKKPRPTNLQSGWQVNNADHVGEFQEEISCSTSVDNLGLDLCDEEILPTASEALNSSERSSSCADLNSVGNSCADDRCSVDEVQDFNNCNEDNTDDTDSSVSSAEDRDGNRIIGFREQLANFLVENLITFETGNKLLRLLKSHRCFVNLPTSPKTLLQTPRTRVQLSNMPPGEYLNLGFESALIDILNCVAAEKIPSMLNVDFSTDGANLDKSGNNQIWPIQCRVANIPNSPVELIGIYRGVKKPESAMVFFQPFVEEVNKIIQNGGIVFNGLKIPIKLRAFIADAPARAYILNHKGHTSHHPCSKCKVCGETIERRSTLQGTDHVLRTDDEYRRCVDDEHHKEGESPLFYLDMGMVSQVPFEYMHLVCLGVVKRLLMAWVDGKFSTRSRLSAHDIGLISTRLEHLYNYCPKEFARRPKTLSLYLKYKATEFREFLLYTGPTVLLGILSDDIYNHFLLLHASMRILASTHPSSEHLFYAKNALRLFVQSSPSLYGSAFVSYNVHGLLHVVDDCKLLGPLDAFSAFPYENNIRLIGKYCKKPNLPLQQIANRRAESTLRFGLVRQKISKSIVALDPHNNGPVPINMVGNAISQYRRLKTPEFLLSQSKRNRCCMLRDSTICIVENVVLNRGIHYIIYRKFSIIEDLYNVALPSSSVGVFKCAALEENLLFIESDQVLNKCYLMPYWQSYHLDANGKEKQADGVFIVAVMSSIVNY